MQVAWCPSLTCKPAQSRALARLGIRPRNTSDGLPTHVGRAAGSLQWLDSHLNISIIQAFWPDKLAAFAACMLCRNVQLQLPPHLVDSFARRFAPYRLLAQQQLTGLATPAFHVPDGSVVFHLEDINPDKNLLD